MLLLTAQRDETVVGFLSGIALLLFQDLAVLIQQCHDQVAGGGRAKPGILHIDRNGGFGVLPILCDVEIAHERHVLTSAGLEVVAGNGGIVVGANRLGHCAVSIHDLRHDIDGHTVFGDFDSVRTITPDEGRHVKDHLCAVAALVDHRKRSVVADDDRAKAADCCFAARIGPEGELYAPATAGKGRVQTVIQLDLDGAFAVDFLHNSRVGDLQIREVQIDLAVSCPRVRGIFGGLERRSHSILRIGDGVYGNVVIRPELEGVAGQQVQVGIPCLG